MANNGATDKIDNRRIYVKYVYYILTLSPYFKILKGFPDLTDQSEILQDQSYKNTITSYAKIRCVENKEPDSLDK